MTVCYLGLGSNLGNRRRNIKLAVEKINSLKDTKVVEISKIIETKPAGSPLPQANKFLNAALKIKTKLSPLTLLNRLQAIEQELGRPKKHTRNSPRTVDLDILFYGDRIVKRKNLVIPHPRIFKRQFVLNPLSEIL